MLFYFRRVCVLDMRNVMLNSNSSLDQRPDTLHRRIFFIIISLECGWRVSQKCSKIDEDHFRFAEFIRLYVTETAYIYYDSRPCIKRVSAWFLMDRQHPCRLQAITEMDRMQWIQNLNFLFIVHLMINFESFWCYICFINKSKYFMK